MGGGWDGGMEGWEGRGDRGMGDGGTEEPNKGNLYIFNSYKLHF